MMSKAAGRLVDQFMPQADIIERHETLIHAPAEVVLDVARNFDVQSIPLVRAIFWLGATLLGAAKPPRDLILQRARRRDDRPGRELVMGTVTRPSMPDLTFTPTAQSASRCSQSLMP